MFLRFVLCICLCTTADVYGSLSTETFYQVTGIDQYDNYGDVSLFEHSVNEMTVQVKWNFETSRTNPQCPNRNVTVFLQHGSYPLPYSKNNLTYPDDFFLHRTSLHEIKLNTTGNTTIVTIVAPPAGRWFGAAFINYKEDNEVIKQLTDLDCRYDVRVNVTTLYLLNLPQLVFNAPIEVSLANAEDYKLYRFYIEENVWNYDIKLTHCSGSPRRGRCALRLSVCAGALPHNKTLSHSTNCEENVNSACMLEVVSPVVARWHYLKVERTDDSTVNATITIIMQGCSKPLDETTEQCQTEPRSHTDLSNATETVTMAIPCDLCSTESYDSSTAADIEPNSTETPHRDVCGPVNNLYRLEDMNVPDYAVYSLGPQSIDEILVVSPHQVALVQFDVMPIKDSGGTLLYRAEISQVAISPNHTQNVTIRMCLSPSRIPANSSQYYCPSDGSMEVLLDTEGEESLAATRHVPYPEPGPYFIGFQSYCYVLDNSTGSDPVKLYEPCVENYTQVIFEIKNGPCVNLTCAGHGHCQTYNKGAYVFSSCYCYANYMGYTCEDGTHAMSLSLQMLYTCLLSLSNLFFIPAIVIATRRQYYVEALVYFANMFFSGFYHACDMHPWSIYTLCIMPYHTLSYCDFFLSILSFWMTLLAMCELPQKILSVLHMLGAVALSMGVEWAQHTLVIYVVPISVGLIMVVILWVVRSVRRRHCYPNKTDYLMMLPGFLLAVVGLVIYAFIQDDRNYPYTHSSWHICIATSIVFLLPRRPVVSCCSSKDTDQSSDDFEFDTRSESGLHDDTDHSLLINSRQLQFTGPQHVVSEPDLVI